MMTAGEMNSLPPPSRNQAAMATGRYHPLELYEEDEHGNYPPEAAVASTTFFEDDDDDAMDGEGGSGLRQLQRMRFWHRRRLCVISSSLFAVFAIFGFFSSGKPTQNSSAPSSAAANAANVPGSSSWSLVDASNKYEKGSWVLIDEKRVKDDEGDIQFVSFSGDGKRIAVSSPWTEPQGVVAVFEDHTSCHSEEYLSRMGKPLYSGNNNNGFGEVMTLSRNGNFLGVGGSQDPARVYMYHGSDNDKDQLPPSSTSVTLWRQIGQYLAKEPVDGMALSADGLIAAYYSSSATSGTAQNRLQVQQYDPPFGMWKPMGGSLRAPNGSDGSLALSGSGQILAVGDEDESNGGGAVRVYQYSPATRGWKPLGQVLRNDEEDPFGSFGSTVKLSDNGMILAVGSRRYKNSHGLVRIFFLDVHTNTWKQLGQDLVGMVEGGQFGWTLDLSDEGNVVAVGSGEESVAEVYAFHSSSNDEDSKNAGSWIPTGRLELENRDVNSISLSGDGMHVAMATGRLHVFSFQK